jgi:hypothetical protein
MATATVTKGYNNPTGWISGETVTPEKLNSSQTPSVSVTIDDGEVTASKLSTGAVTGAAGGGKLAASAITGQTAIDALASADTLLIHDDSTSALRKVTWSQVLSAAQPSGSILQVQSSVTSIAGNLASTTIADSGITSVSITRTTTTSKILLEVTGGSAYSTGGHASYTYFYVSHNGATYADAGGAIVEYFYASGSQDYQAHAARYVYTPSSDVTTIAAKVYYKVDNNAAAWNSGTPSAVPFIFTLTEIK